MSDVKRLNYFNYQLLTDQDFSDEQLYHMGMRRRHNKAFHDWGIAEGLTVDRKSDREIVVNSGFAVDREGREIVLPIAITREMIGSGSNTHVFVGVAYKEEQDEEYHQTSGGVEGYSRIREVADVRIDRQHPAADSGIIMLARVELDGAGNIGRIDTSERQDITARLRHGAVKRQHLDNGIVTEEKLAPEMRGAFGARGWVRLTFKPFRLALMHIDARPHDAAPEDPDSEQRFRIDVERAYCDQHARGSLDVPVPPGATRAVAFRVIGDTKGRVQTRLFRTGWNREKNTSERTLVLDETMTGTFHRDYPTSVELDPEFHGLALAVLARGETSIYLVAVKFE